VRQPSAKDAMAGATVRLRVGGMTCGHCTRTVHTALAAVSAVDTVDVDLATGVASVSLTNTTAEPSAEAESLAQLVAALGYDVEVMLLSGGAGTEHSPSGQQQQQQHMVRSVFNESQSPSPWRPRGS
jgi:copper chaperone CopZ